MKVKPESLVNHLEGKTAPVYLLSGDEPLLLQEAADQVRSALKRDGFEERTVLTANRDFSWSTLTTEVMSFHFLLRERWLICDCQQVGLVKMAARLL